MPLYKWSKTAANNGSADSAINFAEGQAPSSVNDSARALMAVVKKWVDDTSGTLTTSGSSTVYTLTTNSVFDTLADMDGATICFIPHTTNGASATLSVDSLTACAINTAPSIAVPAGSLVEGVPYVVTYVNATTEFILRGDIASLSNLNIGGGTALTAPDKADELAIYDASATANRKIAVSDFFTVIHTLTQLTAPDDVDALVIWDDSASTANSITLASLLAVINALTEDTAPNAADFIATYDTSASGAKKVNFQNVNPFGYALLHVRDEKTSGTDGGTFLSGAWRTRTLNTTKTNEITGASLSSNQISLPAGTYYCEAWAASNKIDINKLKIANITGSSDILIGLNAGSDTGIVGNIYSKVSGRFTLSGTTTIELQQRGNASRADTGCGLNAGFGVVEVYAEVKIWKIV